MLRVLNHAPAATCRRRPSLPVQLNTLLAGLTAFALLLPLLGGSLWAQGLLIHEHPHPHPIPLPRPIWPPHPPHPRPPRPLPPVSYRIKSLEVQGKITDQVAQVQVSQTFENTGSRQMEVSFVFPLPYDGAIDRLTFLVDGKEYDAKLLPADEARRIYEGHVRRNRDPALLEWIGTGMFKTSVFPVPAGAQRKVSLRFSQLLRKDGKLTDFLFPMSTAKYTSKPIEEVAIRLSLESSGRLKNIYSPTHEIEIERADNRHAVVKYHQKNTIPQNDFRLFFAANAPGKLGANLLSYRPESSQDGFFVLLASPNIKADGEDQPSKKNVLLVVDRSGSMSGKKIEQAREAMKFVLNNLRDGDLFNLIAYDSTVEPFRPEMQRYNDDTRSAAIGFIEGIYAGGSTNISGALDTALGMLQDDGRPHYVIFLTDGLPTAGETNELKISAGVKRKNQGRARIVNFGVGYDVNSRLLDRLSRDNRGKSEYVRPDEDIETHVSRLYQRISSPVMTDLKVVVDLEDASADQGKAVNRVYPREVTDLFAGEQLVLVGRYKHPGKAKITLSGRVGQRQESFDFPAELVAHSGDPSLMFVEKLWAVRRIGEIIDELDLNGKNQELIDELVALSTKHGILTPYTSFLADETANVRDFARVDRFGARAADSLEALDRKSGQMAFEQRRLKSLFKGAELPLGAQPSSLPRTAATAPPADAAGGLGGFGGGRGASRAPGAASGEAARPAVQLSGKETLYRRGNTWIAANAQGIDLEKDADKIKTVERFSDAYFALIKQNTPAENAILAHQQEGEELIIKLRGLVYRIK